VLALPPCSLRSPKSDRLLDPLRAQGVRADRRVEFIRESLIELQSALRGLGGALIVRHGRAREEVPRLARELGAVAVYANRDYEPLAIARDAEVAQSLRAAGVEFLDFKDQVVFERDEVLNRNGRPYSVFTPYRNAWLRRLDDSDVSAWPVQRYAGALAPCDEGPVPTLATLGFARSPLAELPLPTGMRGARRLFDEFLGRIDVYHHSRDFPAMNGTSRLSVHLRFGTLPVRELVRAARARTGQGAQAWLNELIWREFFQQILWHHPRVVERSFKPEYDAIRWAEDERGFQAWCAGRTGYPLVDAAMRQLNRTGYMHNRLRMVAASFLVKDLGVDWRRGERYFALVLNDYELASNNGGWQWAASSGCDAQPYFPIFNPVTQSQKFDPRGEFIRRYVPGLAHYTERRIHTPWRASPAEQRAAGCIIGRDYPLPIVDHAAARARTLARYAVVKTGRGATGGHPRSTSVWSGEESPS
jgi:deoxyribodipyrimidine photo-lyase